MMKKNEARIAYDTSVEDCKNLLEMLKCTIENHSAVRCSICRYFSFFSL